MPWQWIEWAFTHLTVPIIVGLLDLLPVMSAGALDVSVLITMVDATKPLFPWTALGVALGQWLLLSTLGLVLVVLRLLVKMASLVSTGGW